MLNQLKLPADIQAVIDAAPSVIYPSTRKELLELALGGAGSEGMTVSYDVPGKGIVDEAHTELRSNGVAVNYFEPYMRRRDPNCMTIGDNLPTDKPKYKDRFGEDFDPTRTESFEWLKGQELSVTAFYLGQPFAEGKQYGGVLIAPKNAGFFIGGLGDLQGLVPMDKIDENFEVRSIMFVVPPFRHTKYDGKQIVVHNRNESNGIHEIFSYNLYPGPSAKKGVYGALLTIGEKEDWVTLHASTVKAENDIKGTTVIMHEGASGAGKSEMLEQPHRKDGKLVLGTNLVSGEVKTLDLPNQDTLLPMTDDMAMCHPRHGQSHKLNACDGEDAWFLRVDHVTEQGLDPHMEELTLECDEPLIFLNCKSVEGEPIKVWEHTEDEPGVPCPNPRVIMPRNFVPGIVQGTLDVDVRNFGLRSPYTYKGETSYGIVGMVHILNPALAWIWRLVSPRGHANPSITAGGKLMQSEGVGSYWPFATGRKVTQANILLHQIKNSEDIHYTITPNQHVGAWKVGFMSEWLGRSVLTSTPADFYNKENLEPARCPLLGYTPKKAVVNNGAFEIPQEFLRVETQPEVGEEVYDAGAKMLTDFFKEEVKQFLQDDLEPVGKQIIELFLNDAPVEAYEGLL